MLKTADPQLVKSTYTNALARYVSSVNYAAIPADVVERVTYLMLDGFRARRGVSTEDSRCSRHH